MPRLVPPCLAVFLLAASARAADPDPSKSPRYEEFRKAAYVVVAKLDSAKVTAVLESFPAQYLFEVELTPGEVLRGTFAKGKTVKVGHRVTAKEEPKLPVGTEQLVQLRKIGDRFQVARMEPA